MQNFTSKNSQHVQPVIMQPYGLLAARMKKPLQRRAVDWTGDVVRYLQRRALDSVTVAGTGPVAYYVVSSVPTSFRLCRRATP